MKHATIRFIILFLLINIGLPLHAQYQTNSNFKQPHTSISYDLGISPKLERKDTYMLCLEGCPLYGPNPWDKPHQSLSDHSSTRGISAVVSMIASYYGGNLSQDRIAYYVYAEYSNDSIPEDDLGHKRGLIGLNIVYILKWALNGAAVIRVNGKPSFDDIKYRLDTNRPIIRDDGTTEHKLTIIDGYTIEGENELVHVIDPLTGTESKIPYEDLSVFVIWFPYVYDGVITARSDEPTVWMDSDGDGIVDFDEINRFHTDPYNRDSDGDGIDDKTEIRSYTFLNDDSFDSKDMRKPDLDGDGLRAELDSDSDNGGLPDGLEDLNKNGKVDPGEKDPLDPSDDIQDNITPEDNAEKESSRAIWIFPVALIIATTALIIYFKRVRRREKGARRRKAR
ncbi:MAG: hypothetical protein QW667_03405 [Candidatus Bathyarchaeia archaeon]